MLTVHGEDLHRKLSDQPGSIVTNFLDVNKHVNKITSETRGITQSSPIPEIGHIKWAPTRNICNHRI